VLQQLRSVQHPGDLAFSGCPSGAFGRDALIVSVSVVLKVQPHF